MPGSNTILGCVCTSALYTNYKKIIFYFSNQNNFLLYTVEHRYKEHLIPKHKIHYNHNFVIKELQWNTDITTGYKDRFVITIN